MKSVLGLDIGSHTLKAVEFKQTFRGIESGQLRLHTRSAGEVSLAEDLGHFVSSYELSPEHLVCAIPGDRISSRVLAFPFRDRKKLAAAIPFEIEAEIPFELDDVVIDWDLAEETGRNTRVIVALTKRQEVGAVLDEFREANLEPRVLEAEGFVLANLAALFDLPGIRVLADLGHRKTSLCMLIDGRAVSARTVPIGGHALTEALAQDRGCSLEAAEQTKLEDGIFEPSTGRAGPHTLKVLDRLTRELVRFVEAQDFSGVAESLDPTVSEITIFGGTSKLAGLDDFLYERVGIPLRPLALPSDPAHAELVAGGDLALFAPAIALALRATAETRSTMNFRQDELAYRTDLRQIFIRDLRPTAILAASVMGLLLISGLIGYGLESSRASRLEKQVQQLYDEIFPGLPTANPVPALSQALQSDMERADFLGIYGTNLSAVDLLAELSRRIPADLKVRFEEVTINRRIVKVKVLGETYESADRLKNILAQSPPFTSAEVDKVKRRRRGKGMTFNLILSLGDESEGGENT